LPTVVTAKVQNDRPNNNKDHSQGLSRYCSIGFGRCWRHTEKRKYNFSIGKKVIKGAINGKVIKWDNNIFSISKQVLATGRYLKHVDADPAVDKDSYADSVKVKISMRVAQD